MKKMDGKNGEVDAKLWKNMIFLKSVSNVKMNHEKIAQRLKAENIKQNVSTKVRP